MDIQELSTRLSEDLRLIGLPVDDIEIRFSNKYVKTYYGLYYPKADKYDPFIMLYPYRIPNSNFTYKYEQILDTAIHEMCHHIQWSDPNYVRIKGVVHDAEFWEMYNKYINRAETAGILKGCEEND